MNVCIKMGMKEESDEVTTKTRLLSLELLQVKSYSCCYFVVMLFLTHLLYDQGL